MRHENPHNPSRNPAADAIAGVVLAGGRGSRMDNRDKPLLALNGRCLIDHVIALAQPQVDALVISANRNIALYQQRQLVVLADAIGGYAGPLAGIATAMQWCRQHGFPMLACFPGDVPLFPSDLVARLHDCLLEEQSEVAWLCTDEQWQPLFSLWSTQLYADLQQALEANVYSPMQFIRSRHHSLLIQDDCPPGYFDNLNSADDLRRARKKP